jgi:hypothetical protein
MRPFHVAAWIKDFPRSKQNGTPVERISDEYIGPSERVIGLNRATEDLDQNPCALDLASGRTSGTTGPIRDLTMEILVYMV